MVTYGLRKRFLATLVIFVIGSLGSLNFVQSLTLNSSGGYGIVVAIEEGAEQPENTEFYISKIQHSLQVFSIELARATQGKFFIESADLLLPSDWNYTEAVPATSQSLASSDIRLLSEGDVLPYVENPNACGLPGKFIGLPYTFFDSLNEGPYGKNWKALLAQWARFRWGVWEEHGYPGDAKFPYFYLGKEADLWMENSCSDVPLVGKYENINGATCSNKQREEPSEECRFKPDAINKASSSLMAFHWIDSVTGFCDKDTHNKVAPNRQNLFCNHRSVWEVIRESSDYKKISPESEPTVNVPFMEFRTVQTVAKAKSLYILLDKGSMDGFSHKIIVKAVRELVKLVTEKVEDSVLVALGQYPGNDGSSFEELTNWQMLGLGNYQDELIEQIGDIPADGNKVRDFSAAIMEAVEETGSLPGAVLLVLKTGNQESFDEITYEEEIHMALLSKRIQLFVAEVVNPGGSQPHPVLKNIAERTQGLHMTLSDPNSVWSEIDTLTEKVAEELKLPVDPTVTTETLNRKLILRAKTPIAVSLRQNSTLNIRLTLPKDIKAVIKITGVSDPETQTNGEWGSDVRVTHSYTHEYNETEEELTVEFTCPGSENCNGKTGALFISEKFQSKEDEPKVKVYLASSAIDNQVDFQATPVGFAIYAKIEVAGRPGSNANVTAIAHYGAGSTFKFPLLDNGLGNPDVQKSDGVYSAIFVPPEDGSFTFSVQVKQLPASAQALPSSNQASTRLLPIDQGEIGCGPAGCGGTVPVPEDVEITQDLPSITFKNHEAYPQRGRADRVTDFKAFQPNPQVNELTFEFTSPAVIGSKEKIDSYNIYGASDATTLLNDDLNEGDKIASFLGARDPGLAETFHATLKSTDLIYFAVKAKTNSPTRESLLSNVARMVQGIDAPSTTANPTGPGGSTSAPSSVAPPGGKDEDEGTPFFETAGGIVLIVFLVLLFLGLIGGVGYWFYRRNRGGLFRRDNA